MKILIIIILFAQSLPKNEYFFLNIKYNYESGYFTIPLSFGSENEIFELQIDTTSSVSWIPSPKFPLDVKKYNISDSSTGILTKQSLELEDEDGTVFGKACYDTIKIGNYDLEHFGFGLINVVDYKFNDYPQGKLGLGYNPKNDENFNFVKQLKKIGIIEKEEFMIEKLENYLILGDVSKMFEKVRHTACYLVETNDLDREYKNSWACNLNAFFFYYSYEVINDAIVNQIYYNDFIKVEGRVIFDSTFKYISFPNSYFGSFTSLFFKGFGETCYLFKDIDSKYFICYNESFIRNAKIYFLINDEIYILYFENLFKKNNDGGYELLIRFYKENDNVFCFGNPFVYSFDISYDSEEKKISFYGGNSYSYSELLYKIQKEINDKNWEDAKNFFKFIVYCVVFFVVIFFPAWFIYDKCIKKN